MWNKWFQLIFLACLAVVLSACQTSSTKADETKIAHSALSNEIKQKYAYALQLMGAGDYDAALNFLNSVTALNDSLSGPYANRGLIYLALNNKEKAEKQFKNAVWRNSSNVTALNQLGVLMREKKDFSAARKNYEAALAVDENHLNAHLNLGVLCDIYLQDKKCAMQHFEAYQRLNGEDEKVANWIVDLKEQL